MKAVYLVGPKRDDETLRYSLRSLENVPQINEALVCGYVPPWFRGTVIEEPRRTDKYAACSAALKTVCAAIHDDFLWLDDDMYFLSAPTDLFLNWHRGSLAERVEQFRYRHEGNPSYRGGLVQALDNLRALGIPDPLDYELHIPHVVNGTLLANMFTRLDYEGITARGTARTFYGNLVGFQGLLEQHRDVKVAKKDAGFHDPLLGSTSKRSFSGAAGDWLRNRFPRPSRWET